MYERQKKKPSKSVPLKLNSQIKPSNAEKDRK